MFTLRDLWMMLSPQYEQQWREKQAKKWSDNTGDDSTAPIGLRELFRQKQNLIHDSPEMQGNKPLSIQDYYNEMTNGYQRVKSPNRQYY